MPNIKDCPKCKAEDSLETTLKIDLDDVVLDENMEIVSFTPAGSANDPNTGLVYEEARVTCRNCGHDVGGFAKPDIIDNWTYTGDN